MMLFNLNNPSDRYTFTATDLECAAVAVAIVGNGQYSANQLDGEAKVPFFMFGGVNEWFTERFGHNFEVAYDLFVGPRAAELEACLRSFLIGDRAEYERTLPLIQPEKRVEWIAGWHEKHRTSMNNIGANARRAADKLAEFVAKHPA